MAGSSVLLPHVDSKTLGPFAGFNRQEQQHLLGILAPTVIHTSKITSYPEILYLPTRPYHTGGQRICYSARRSTTGHPSTWVPEYRVSRNSCTDGPLRRTLAYVAPRYNVCLCHPVHGKYRSRSPTEVFRVAQAVTAWHYMYCYHLYYY
eukprot:3674045-Rhodomonas_salina.1